MHLAKLEHIESVKRQLMDMTVGEKKYWKLAKEIYGSKKTMGIPALNVDNKPITTSSDKATCFNKYFADQQTLPKFLLINRCPP